MHHFPRRFFSGQRDRSPVQKHAKRFVLGRRRLQARPQPRGRRFVPGLGRDPGGARRATDLAARLIANRMMAELKQSLVADNGGDSLAWQSSREAWKLGWTLGGDTQRETVFTALLGDARQGLPRRPEAEGTVRRRVAMRLFAGNEHRHGAALQDRVDRRREAGGHADQGAEDAPPIGVNPAADVAVRRKPLLDLA